MALDSQTSPSGTSTTRPLPPPPRPLFPWPSCASSGSGFVLPWRVHPESPSVEKRGRRTQSWHASYRQPQALFSPGEGGAQRVFLPKICYMPETAIYSRFLGRFIFSCRLQLPTHLASENMTVLEQSALRHVYTSLLYNNTEWGVAVMSGD